MTQFSDLIGKTVVRIEGGVGDEELKFFTAEGQTFRLYHYQDCCETVDLNDIAGDLADLIGTPILLAEEAVHDNEPAPDTGDVGSDSYTWTFYKLATVKGHVTLRWLGESNGYYSEGVDFEEVSA